MPESVIRAVIDTNVVFEGLTRRGGAAGLVIDAWEARLFTACVSNALTLEYVDVLSGKLTASRWLRLRPALGRLLTGSEPVSIYFTWRPSSPDPGDEHVIDCAMNAGAAVVTSNVRDFRAARRTLGLPILRPRQFVTYLADRA